MSAVKDPGIGVSNDKYVKTQRFIIFWDSSSRSSVKVIYQENALL